MNCCLASAVLQRPRKAVWRNAVAAQWLAAAAAAPSTRAQAGDEFFQMCRSTGSTGHRATEPPSILLEPTGLSCSFPLCFLLYSAKVEIGSTVLAIVIGSCVNTFLATLSLLRWSPTPRRAILTLTSVFLSPLMPPSLWRY